MGLPNGYTLFPLSLSFRCGYPLLVGLYRADPGKSGRTRAAPGGALEEGRRTCEKWRGATTCPEQSRKEVGGFVV